MRRSMQPSTKMKVWLKFLKTVKGVTTLVSLFMCPIMTGFIIYNLYTFDPVKVLTGCAVIFTMLHLNIKIQGV